MPAREWCVVVGVVGIVATSGEAGASGFFLLEESARLQGTSYAGTAAAAEDASTVFYNPAGMSRIKDWSFSQSGYWVAIQNELENATATNFGQPVTGPNGSNSSSPGTDSPVGATMFAKRLTDDLVAGFAFTVPFGLEFVYPNDSIARFIATKSKLITYNLSPSLAWEPIDGLSIGVGFDAAQATVSLNQKLGLPGQDEINVRLSADDWTYGWNAGLLWEIDDDYRIGFAYRSRLTFGLHGTGQLTPNQTFDQVQAAEATVTFPDMWTLSGVAKVAPGWQLLGDLAWTHWGLIQDIAVKFNPRGVGGGKQILPEQTLALQFRDTWRGALGVQHFFDENWTFRGGFGFDQSPVTNNNRTARLPDSNRLLLSVGVGYALSKYMAVDVAYTHLFLPWEATIDQAVFPATLTGEYSSAVDLFGIQLTFTFDEGLVLPFVDF
jgi:long-chain fatty acid transport protein